jgi:hypothetical protein
MNYTLAMEACILITLYRCSGEWVSIEQIAARLGVARERALAVCADLSTHARVRHSVVEGRDMYASCIGTDRS